MEAKGSRKYLNDAKKPGFFKKISLWWEFEGKYIITNIKQGLENIRYWFPIVWHDRNYDYSYIYEILKHKLKSQSKYLYDKNTFESSRQSSSRINICVALISKLQDSYYSLEYCNYIKEKHWFEKTEEDSNLYTWESDLVWENLNEYINKYPLIYKRVMEGEGPFEISDKNDKKTIAMNIGHINQKRAHRLLFKILEEDIERWWN
jgi:hypothetical protein